MDFEPDIEPDEGEEDEISPQNEFTGALRQPVTPPSADEPICLISYEISVILLGGGPQTRPSFWKHYRNELALNRRTNYQNYHVQVCRHQLSSLHMKRDLPVYFRNNKLTIEKDLDSFPKSLLH